MTNLAVEKSDNLKSFTPRTYNFLCVLLICIAFVNVFSTFRYVKYVVDADEGYYLSSAQYIGEKGIKGFSDSFKHYFDISKNRIYQNPLRIGAIIIASSWLKIFGYNYESLAFFSLWAYLLLLCFFYVFAKKYFGYQNAIFSLVLLVCSPLNMAMARRALLDSLSGLTVFLSIWLFFEYLHDKKAYKTILFVLTFALTILIKESAALLALLFLIYDVIVKVRRHEPIKLEDFLVAVLLPLGITAVVYVYLAGGLSSFLSVAIGVVTSPDVNIYATYFCAGPWFRYLIDFMILSPWTLLLSVAYVFYRLASGSIKEIEGYLMFLIVGLLIVFNFLIKNVRYLIILDIPIRLFSVLMLQIICQRIFKKKYLVVLVSLVLLIACFDYLRFHYIFVQKKAYDPASIVLLKHTRIIPW